MMGTWMTGTAPSRSASSVRKRSRVPKHAWCPDSTQSTFWRPPSNKTLDQIIFNIMKKSHFVDFLFRTGSFCDTQEWMGLYGTCLQSWPKMLVPLKYSRKWNISPRKLQSHIFWYACLFPLCVLEQHKKKNSTQNSKNGPDKITGTLSVISGCTPFE